MAGSLENFQSFSNCIINSQWMKPGIWQSKGTHGLSVHGADWKTQKCTALFTAKRMSDKRELYFIHTLYFIHINTLNGSQSSLCNNFLCSVSLLLRRRNTQDMLARWWFDHILRWNPKVSHQLASRAHRQPNSRAKDIKMCSSVAGKKRQQQRRQRQQPPHQKCKQINAIVCVCFYGRLAIKPPNKDESSAREPWTEWRRKWEDEREKSDGKEVEAHICSDGV